MPERTPYDEAMLMSPARLKVPDPDLKQGKVETITLRTAAGTMQRPWGVQGGFAVVYKFRTQSGKMRALRCFLVQMTPDTQFRYERISTYFAAHAPNITVGFKYYDAGIILKEQVYGQLQSRTYPVIEMEWIEGVTLVDRVDELSRQRDRVGLEDLVNQWLAILRTLHAADISHGDLAGVNVMVRPSGRLVLVDYDGVYIPDFAGLPQIVLGQTDYQHPQMNLRPFNERTDDFSAQVIYTALLALQVQPELWDKYTHRNTQGGLLDTNLLFKQQDFVDPDRSVLFAELERISDPRVRKAIQKLKQACGQSVTQVVFEEPSPEKEALAKLEHAIQSDNDEEIVKAWISTLLDNYGPAQQYAARVAHARQVVSALKHFQDALQAHSLQQIVAAYDPIINNCKGFTQEQAELLVLAYEFMKAYQNDDDQAIVSALEAIESSRHKGNLMLSVQERQRVALAQQRKIALVRFRLGLMNKSVQQVVTNYDASLLDTCAGVTLQERDLLRVAQDFVQAYQSDDDQGIVAASEAIQNFSYRTSFAFTAQEQQRITFAQQRKMALVKFRLGLMSKNAQQIIANYDWVLDDCKNITAQERDILRIAKDFVQAYHKGDDETIAAAWDVIQKASYQKFFVFSVQEQQRINLIRQSKAALLKFQLALASKNAKQMVTDYDAVLDDNRAITYEERNLLGLARRFVEAYQGDDDQALVSTWEEIQDPRYLQSFLFTQREQQRIHLAQQRKVALVKFRLAMMSKNIQQIVAAYDPLLDGCSNVTQEEHEQLTLVRRFVQAYKNDDDQAILYTWTAIQNSPYQKSFVLTPQESQRVTLALTRSVGQGRPPHA
jgi:hypothetical protein